MRILRKTTENSVMLPDFLTHQEGLSCPHRYISKWKCFLTMFPPAVPNDPLVPTAVLGETSSVVGYVTSITSSTCSDHPPSSSCPCNPGTYYPLLVKTSFTMTFDIRVNQKFGFLGCFCTVTVFLIYLILKMNP